MKKILLGILFIAGFAVLASCGGGGGTGGGSSEPPSAANASGMLSLNITDSATNEYKAVYVTIDEVQVHKNSGDPWRTISTPKKTVNLLNLVNGVRESLALTSLESGHYTEMRLILGNKADSAVNILSQGHPYANYLINTGNEAVELKVPSGFQTGLKIVQGFDIGENQTTELLLDFDATRSIVKAGTTGKWLLKPAIKMLNTLEYSIIFGAVRDAGGTPKGVAGVLVSAQNYNGAASDPSNGVVAEAATVTDENGAFRIFLRPGAYMVAACADGYSPSAQDMSTQAGTAQEKNFTIGAVETGTLNVGVAIAGADDEPYAAISVRRVINNEQIEIKSFNLANQNSATTVLPPGTYLIVASTSGRTTQTANVTVTAGQTMTLPLFSF